MTLTPKEKAKELVSQFGSNAKYVVLEILDALKGTIVEQDTIDIIYWREIKKEIEKNEIKLR